MLRASTFVVCTPLQVRNYEVYRLLEESLKAMLTSLPLVQVRWIQPSRLKGPCISPALGSPKHHCNAAPALECSALMPDC